MEEISISLWDSTYKFSSFEIIQQFYIEANIIFDRKCLNHIDINYEDDQLVFIADIFDKAAIIRKFKMEEKTLDKKSFKGFFYHFLEKVTNKSLDWGAFTGVKPVKYAHQLLRAGRTKEEIKEYFLKSFKISLNKTELTIEIAKNELPIIYPISPHKVSVYIGIPMCFSRCNYCSFVTTLVDKKRENLNTYLKNLFIEIEKTGTYLRNKGIIIDTLYIGGGTPSILDEAEIKKLMDTIHKHLNLSVMREFTFEAGRPESTTIDKLITLKKSGVDRICINPQSMNHETLKSINRNYTPEEIKRAYRLIKNIGFRTINMDLILGLSNESEEAFLDTLSEITELDPENITIHCLSLKKGSELKNQKGKKVANPYSNNFINSLPQVMKKMNYKPYYLYRQKYAMANGENIGYCKPGYEGIYNILIMAERQSIIGIGAGSSGKIYNRDKDLFSRVFTVKDVKTYNESFEEIVKKKMIAYKNLGE